MTEATPGRCAWRSCCASFVLNPFFASTLPRARLDVTRSPEPLLSQGLEGAGRVPPPLCLLAPDLRRLSALCLSEGTLSRRTSCSSQRPLWHGGSDGVATVQEAPLSSCLQRLVISCSVYSVSTLDFSPRVRESSPRRKGGRQSQERGRAGRTLGSCVVSGSLAKPPRLQPRSADRAFPSLPGMSLLGHVCCLRHRRGTAMGCVACVEAWQPSVDDSPGEICQAPSLKANTTAFCSRTEPTFDTQLVLGKWFHLFPSARERRKNSSAISKTRPCPRADYA